MNHRLKLTAPVLIPADSQASVLAAGSLRHSCDPRSFPFITTAEVEKNLDTPGHERAEEAISFGIEIKSPGHNVFAMGESGSGRHAAVLRLLRAKAAGEPAPDDWCYVNNFDEVRKPCALALPPGRGILLKQDMEQFVSELGTAIASGFDTEEYRSRLELIKEEFKKKHEDALHSLGEDAMKSGVALLSGPEGFFFMPMKGKETISPEDFAKLPEDEQKQFEKAIEKNSEKLEKLTGQFPRWRRDLQKKIREINQETMKLAVGHLIEDLKEGYKGIPAVIGFLDRVFIDVIKVGDELRRGGRGQEDTESAPTGSIALERFQINLIVDRSGQTTAPVVYEESPNFPNLLGRFDQIAHLGSLLTNFSLIRGGALHRANGGYLVLDAEKLLTQPFAYDGLKRALKSRKLLIESPGQLLGLMSTLTLEPEEMPLNVKVVLVGDRRVYYLLKELDPEFDELFKVMADFESDIERTADNVQSYAKLVGRLAHVNNLRPFTREAVARIVEYGSRMSGDSERLTTRTRLIADIMSEADHWAAKRNESVVDVVHLEDALAAQIRRADRVRNTLQREIVRDTLLIATTGAEVGQINGLAVVDFPDYAFAHPVRITANTWQGKGGVIDIEREVELGGKIHSKGVLILSSFLASRFARTEPLSLGASLVFEQSYGPVEGDSASLAELCALLSSLSGIPILQSLAVTGSINQHGRVQAIGGVNEKIEGFFDLCRARGLTGEQGVLIPTANVKYLMLRDDVVQACAEKRFTVYAVDTVDEAIEILTKTKIGTPDQLGRIPKGTVNFYVNQRLDTMANAARSDTQRQTKRPRK
ncbi:MAG: AAA family ATPase [Spirochaetia bacterium]|nr:AAA family ATPase [Spirochaetia bacterium]